MILDRNHKKTFLLIKIFFWIFLAKILNYFFWKRFFKSVKLSTKEYKNRTIYEFFLITLNISCLRKFFTIFSIIFHHKINHNFFQFLIYIKLPFLWLFFETLHDVKFEHFINIATWIEFLFKKSLFFCQIVATC